MHRKKALFKTLHVKHAIPTTCESEAGGWLEPRSSRPAWATYRDPPISKKKRNVYITVFEFILGKDSNDKERLRIKPCPSHNSHPTLCKSQVFMVHHPGKSSPKPFRPPSLFPSSFHGHTVPRLPPHVLSSALSSLTRSLLQCPLQSPNPHFCSVLFHCSLHYLAGCENYLRTLFLASSLYLPTRTSAQGG
jgi:hypothetical protein